MTSYEEIVNFSEALRAAGIENELIELLNCDTLHEFINGVGENDIVVIILNEDLSCQFLIVLQSDQNHS